METADTSRAGEPEDGPQETEQGAVRRFSLSPLLPVHHPNIGKRAKVHARNWFWPRNMHYTLLHPTSLFPHQDVANNPDMVRPLPAAPVDLEGLTYAGPGGKTETLKSLLHLRETDAFLVLYGGKLVFEYLADDMQDVVNHWALSMCRTVTGVVAGRLAAGGLLDLNAPVETYVPELAKTTYKGATTRQVLGMRTGEKGSHIVRIMYEAGLYSWRKTPSRQPTSGIHEHILSKTRKKDAGAYGAEHGGAFKYSCLDTEVLGWVCERAAGGRPLPQLVSELVWIPMGAEEPAAWLVDRASTAQYGSGLCACPRDIARFGLALAEDGNVVAATGWPGSPGHGEGWRATGIENVDNVKRAEGAAAAVVGGAGAADAALTAGAATGTAAVAGGAGAMTGAVGVSNAPDGEEDSKTRRREGRQEEEDDQRRSNVGGSGGGGGGGWGRDEAHRPPVAPGWTTDATRADAESQQAFSGSFFGVPAPRGQYRSHMWVLDAEHGAGLSYGAFGQFVHVDPKAATVCVVLSSWRRPADKRLAGRWLRAFDAVGERLAGGTAATAERDGDAVVAQR